MSKKDTFLEKLQKISIFIIALFNIFLILTLAFIVYLFISTFLKILTYIAALFIVIVVLILLYKNQ